MSKKLTKTQQWLKNQKSRHTDLSLVLPTVGEYNKLPANKKEAVKLGLPVDDKGRYNGATKRDYTSIMSNWNNKRSPSSQAKALNDAINKRREMRTRNNELVGGKSLFNAVSVSKLVINMGKQTTDIQDKNNRVVAFSSQYNGNKNKLAQILNNSNQVGSAYKTRKEQLMIKRLIEFKKADHIELKRFSRNTFKDVIENYIAYLENDGSVTIIDDGTYVTTAMSLDEARAIIYKELDKQIMSYDEFTAKYDNSGNIRGRSGRFKR